MPRYLLDRRYWDRLKTRPPNVWQGDTGPTYIDYFPDVIGTLPEKMLFNELAKRRINFYFSHYFGDLPFTPDDTERYRPDFILPDYNIIIDVQGVYWHSRPGKYELDYYRASQLTAAGWRMIFITDLEIVANVVDALDRNAPELINPVHTGTFRAVGERPFRPTAPIIARIKARPKVQRTKFAKRRPAGTAPRLKPLASWNPNSPTKFKTVYGPLFDTGAFDIEYLDQITLYSQQWQDYLASLTDLFDEDPIVSWWWAGNDQGEGYWAAQHASGAYPNEFRYWKKWRFWWARFRVGETA